MKEQASFGGIIVPKDPRDYDLSKVGANVPIPDRYLPDISELPIEHQRQQPSCGAHAGTMVKNIIAFHKGEEKRLSPRYFWKMIKSLDGWALEAGTDMYSILKAMRDKATCNWEQTKDDTSLPLRDYVNLDITPAMEVVALDERIESFATIFDPTFEQIKRAIYVNKGVIMLTRVGQNMYRPSWKEKDIMPLDPDKYPMDGGHFVALYGYDKDRVYYRNSWGKDWAKKGDGYFEEDYIKWVDSIGTMVERDDVTNEILPAFTRDLTIGSTGSEVKNLQIYLNNKGFLVAKKGAGSKGNETAYFGQLTKNALADFQFENGIKPSVGYFGPITRKFVNEHK